jgi:hypothetical protein
LVLSARSSEEYSESSECSACGTFRLRLPDISRDGVEQAVGSCQKSCISTATSSRSLSSLPHLEMSVSSISHIILLY